MIKGAEGMSESKLQVDQMDDGVPRTTLSAIIVDEDMTAAVDLGRQLRRFGVLVAAVTDVTSVGRALLAMETDLLFLAVRSGRVDTIVEIGRAALERQIQVILTGEVVEDLAAELPGARQLVSPLAFNELARMLGAKASKRRE
jgi:hypothetical protein